MSPLLSFFQQINALKSPLLTPFQVDLAIETSSKKNTLYFKGNNLANIISYTNIQSLEKQLTSFKQLKENTIINENTFPTSFSIKLPSKIEVFLGKKKNIRKTKLNLFEEYNMKKGTLIATDASNFSVNDFTVLSTLELKLLKNGFYQGTWKLKNRNISSIFKKRNITKIKEKWLKN